MSAAFALLASALWGTSDFFGGTLSRRLPTLTVIFVSQLAALVVFAFVVALPGVAHPVGAYLLWGIACGVVGPLALLAFYRALAVGRMGIVAPVAATGVMVPVLVGLTSGERPGVGPLVGIAVAVVGVVLAAGPETRLGAPTSIVLAVAAAVAFGLFFTFFALGSAVDPIMTLVTQRAVNIVVVGGVLLATRRPLGVRAGHLPALALVGCADTAANLAYGVASQHSLVSVTAVLASLYPIVTALLAYRVHGERLRPVQMVGTAAAMAGVVLLAVT